MDVNRISSLNQGESSRAESSEQSRAQSSKQRSDLLWLKSFLKAQVSYFPKLEFFFSFLNKISKIISKHAILSVKIFFHLDLLDYPLKNKNKK